MSKKIRLGKRQIKNKINLFKEAVDFPAGALEKGANITLFSNKEAVIDGCYGIIEYSDCFIKLSIGNQVIALTGCDFDIFDYTDCSITVRGFIKGLEFC